ncbi:hypothetical protein PG985_007535 [Apiospora marii]
MVTEQAFHEAIDTQVDKFVYKAVSKAMKDDNDALHVEPVSNGLQNLSLSNESFAIDRAQALLHMPRPILRQHRMPRMIDSDIKREKKRKRVQFSDDEPEVMGTKKIKVNEPTASSMPPTEQPRKKPGIKTKRTSDAAAKAKSEGQTEPNQCTTKRLGPLRTYMKSRQRLAWINSMPPIPSHAVEYESESSHQEHAPEFSTTPPYIAAALTAVRRSDRH